MKKRTNPANRYNGFNAYGQRCEVHTVKLNPKTALEQCLKIVEKVEIQSYYCRSCTNY